MVREDLVHFRNFEGSTLGTDTSAVGALAKKVVPDYGGGALGSPDLASYGAARLRYSPQGSIAVPIEKLLPGLGANVVVVHIRSLRGGGDRPQTPQPYWSLDLSSDPKVYADPVETLLCAEV